MIDIEIDADTYSKVATGLVHRVLRALIRGLADAGVIDLSQDLRPEDLDMIYTLAFGVLVQFEDLRGHTYDDHRYPAVVGFIRTPAKGKLDLKKPETILISRRRTDLHGAFDHDDICRAFAELQSN